MCVYQVYIVLFVFSMYVYAIQEYENDVLVLVMKNKETEGFTRMMREATRLQLDVKVLEILQSKTRKMEINEDTCEPGNVFCVEDTKLTIVGKEIEKYKDEKEKVILILDSTEDYNILLIDEEHEILDAFLRLEANIVVSATNSPLAPSLQNEYPRTKRGRRYLDSGGVIGYASDLHDVITTALVMQKKDYRSYFEEIYLNKQIREKYRIKVDHLSRIFHNWIDDSELTLETMNDEYYLYNRDTSSVPLIVKGHRSESMNYAGDYVGKAYNLETGCKECKENTISLKDAQDEDLPVVLVGVFIEQPTPFFEEFLIDLDNINYPKQKIHLYVHIAHQYNKKQMEEYIEEHKHTYRSIHYMENEIEMKEARARQQAIQLALKKNCDYYLSLDATVHLDNPEALKLLIEQNRSVVAPNLRKNYDDIVKYTSEGAKGHRPDDLRGVWNVPCISAIYLINGTILRSNQDAFSYLSDEDEDGNETSTFCTNMRNEGIFMYETDRFEFGHLVTTAAFNSSRLHGEMYEASSNRWDWEQRYIVHNHSLYFHDNVTMEQPCTDVYWFPVTTPRYCKELIDIAEHFNIWAHGIKRTQDGKTTYGSYPTVDTHLHDVGLKEAWMVLLKKYIHPVTERLFYGYESENMTSDDDFIVRYKPEEQASLVPHYDGSLYSVNMALNSPLEDYEGGGTRFTRYNCSVTATRLGWILLHPSRFTHQHEGLPTTKGTRYVLVSFVDPHWGRRDDLLNLEEII